MTIRPYLPPPRAGRATVRRVTLRRGRQTAAAADARRSQAVAILATEPGISGAELARRLGVSPARGVQLLAEIRASVPDLPPAPAPPPAADQVVRLTSVQVERLATFEGATTRDQLDTVLGIAEQQRPTGRGKD